MSITLDQLSAYSGIIPPAQRLNALYAPLKLKVLFGEGEHGTLGRGSVRIMPRLRMYRMAEAPTPLFDIGNYCDTAQCDILIGGEHFNDRAFNYTLTDLEAIARGNTPHPFEATHAPATTVLGANVTIGLDAKILSGVAIGNGAVIGAGAVVTKDVPPFAVVAGAPTEVKKYRFSEKDIEALQHFRWWDLAPEFLFSNLDAFKEADISATIDRLTERADGKLPYDTDDTRLVLQCLNMQDNRPVNAGVAGVEQAGTLTPANQLPPAFQSFVSQFQTPADKPVHLLWQLDTLLETHKASA